MSNVAKSFISPSELNIWPVDLARHKSPVPCLHVSGEARRKEETDAGSDIMWPNREEEVCNPRPRGYIRVEKTVAATMAAVVRGHLDGARVTLEGGKVNY